MLVDNDWFFIFQLSVILSSSAYGTRNSENTVDIAICSCVKMFFYWIFIVHDHLHERLVLIFLNSKTVAKVRNPSFKIVDVSIDFRCN